MATVVFSFDLSLPATVFVAGMRPDSHVGSGTHCFEGRVGWQADDMAIKGSRGEEKGAKRSEAWRHHRSSFKKSKTVMKSSGTGAS